MVAGIADSAPAKFMFSPASVQEQSHIDSMDVDFEPDFHFISKRILADFETWLQPQARQETDEGREIVSFDFLLFSDECPLTGQAFLTDPFRVVSVIRATYGNAKRIVVRPFNFSAVMRSSMPWGARGKQSLIEIVGTIVVLSSPQNRVHSRLVQCPNKFCEGNDPFTLTTQELAACPKCSGPLTEDCRARVMFPVRYICISIHKTKASDSGLARNLVVLLEDDLAECTLQLHQHIRVCGYLQASDAATLTMSKVHGFGDTKVHMMCMGISTGIDLPPRPLLPVSTSTPSPLRAAVAHLHDLAWSLLPGFKFCEKAKLGLLLALVSGSPRVSASESSGNGVRFGGSPSSNAPDTISCGPSPVSSPAFPVQGTPIRAGRFGSHTFGQDFCGTPARTNEQVHSRFGMPSSPAASITESMAGSVSSCSSSVFAAAGRKGRRPRERVHVLFCGGHYSIITCLANRLRSLSKSASHPLPIPVEWVTPGCDAGGLWPSFQVTMIDMFSSNIYSFITVGCSKSIGTQIAVTMTKFFFSDDWRRLAAGIFPSAACQWRGGTLRRGLLGQETLGYFCRS